MWLTLCRAQINTFYWFSWCFPDVQTLREKKKGTCVCSPVSLQLVAACEPLPTEHPAANKRSLPWMPAQVCSQVRCLSIYFPTACNVADVLLLFPRAGSSVKHRYGWVRVLICVLPMQSRTDIEKGTCWAYSPPTRLFTVGASAGHSAQPLALLTQLFILVHQPDAKVRQIARVQGGVGA